MVRVLEINNLNYKDFHNINLSFESNTFYSIVGDNNSGKTTLFKIIAGFIKTSAYIKCSSILLSNRYHYIKNIGIVMCVDKNSFLFENVIDEIRYPLKNLGYKDNYINERINDILDLLGLKRIINKKINDLNIYDKQKLLLCISLLHMPKVLIMDDVLNIFNSKERTSIIKALKSINGLCVINFTNSLDDILNMDKIILMNKSKIIKEIDVNDVFLDDKIFYENNVEIPFIIDLNIKLRMYNLINKNYDNVKDMVNDIWQ